MSPVFYHPSPHVRLPRMRLRGLGDCVVIDDGGNIVNRFPSGGGGGEARIIAHLFGLGQDDGGGDSGAVAPFADLSQLETAPIPSDITAAEFPATDITSVQPFTEEAAQALSLDDQAELIMQLVDQGLSDQDALLAVSSLASGQLSLSDFNAIAAGDIDPSQIREFIVGTGMPVQAPTAAGKAAAGKPGAAPPAGGAPGGAPPSGPRPSPRVPTGPQAPSPVPGRVPTTVPWWDQEIIKGLPNKYLVIGGVALVLLAPGSSPSRSRRAR